METKEVVQSSPKLKVSAKLAAEAKVAAKQKRGLRAYVFAEFAKAKDLASMISQEELTKLVKINFPESKWLQNPKVHYSYYRTKFFAAINAKVIETMAQ